MQTEQDCAERQGKVRSRGASKWQPLREPHRELTVCLLCSDFASQGAQQIQELTMLPDVKLGMCYYYVLCIIDLGCHCGSDQRLKIV